VTDVFVAGRPLLKDGVLTTLDASEVLAKAREWAMKIKP
jgi:5-methylthioadenosine/S-adenosylhomocysteine deaminase